MKAVVTEIRDAFAAVLSDDGRIIKVKNQNYAIGQVITMKETNLKTKHKIIPWVAAAFAVFTISGISAHAYYSPYSYISLDVNPSIEYTVNRFDRVLSAEAVNGDGENILDEIGLENIENKSIETAVSLTVEEIAANGYFEGGEGGIVIATFGEDSEKAEELATTLQETAEEATEAEAVEVEAVSVGLERVQKARELGVTPGKLNLVEKLQASSANPEEIKLEDWLNKPVKVIMKEIKANRKGTQSEDPAEDPENDDSTKETLATDAKAATEGQSTANKVQQKVEQKTQQKTEQIEQKAQAKTEQAEKKATQKIEQIEQKVDKTVQKVEEKAEKAVQKVEQKTEEKTDQKVPEKKPEKVENTANQPNSNSSQSKSNEKEQTTDSQDTVSNGNSNSNSDNDNASKGNSGNSSSEKSSSNSSSGSGNSSKSKSKPN